MWGLAHCSKDDHSIEGTVLVADQHKLRALWAVLLAVLIGVLSSGCSKSEEIPSLPDVGTYGGGSVYVPPKTESAAPVGLTMALVVGQDATINPVLTREKDIVSLNKLAFESLVELDDSMRPVPLLADRWTRDGNVWTFYLRKENYFHIEAYVTAHDVVASYIAYISSPDTNPYAAALINFVSNMYATDDYTLVVDGKASYLTLYAMTFPVIEKGSIYTATPRGSGPYRYIQNNPNGQLFLDINPNWWKNLPTVPTITTIRYSSPEEAVLAFDAGLVDLMATRSPAASLSNSLSDRMSIDYSTLTYECIVPNLNKSILSDISVRKALMYAIDRDELASTVYLSMVNKTEVPVHPTSFLYEPQSTEYNYNPEMALKILYDAGWADSDGDQILDRVKDNLVQDLTLHLITYLEPTHSTRHEAIKRIAQQLRKVGMRVEVSTVDKNKMLSALKDGDFDLALIANELSEIPDLSFLLSSDGSGNMSGYSSAAMDGYLQAVRAAQTEEELIAAMSDVQMQVVADLPILGLFFRAGLVVSREDITGLSGSRESQTLRGLEFVGADLK